MNAGQFAHPCPEPGDDIQRVADPDGDVWKRTSKGWVCHGWGGEPTPWDELLEQAQILDDVTGEDYEEKDMLGPLDLPS